MAAPRLTGSTEHPLLRPLFPLISQTMDAMAVNPNHFSDADRLKAFAHHFGTDNKAEGLRVALSCNEFAASPHCDDKNDTHPNWSPVYVYIVYVTIDGIEYRFCVIAYAKRSIGGVLLRISTYKPIIQFISPSMTNFLPKKKPSSNQCY